MISILLIGVIFFLSSATLHIASSLLHTTFRSRHIVIALIALAYFPGTLIHELSHYIVALVLNMHPSDLSVFPSTSGNAIRLGHVLFEKQNCLINKKNELI